MRVLVCGGTKFKDEELLYSTLDTEHAKEAFTMVIEGEAPGADRMARSWADLRGVPVLPMPAPWEYLKRGAGPMRNTTMLNVGRPNRVIAFGGDRGTDNMVMQSLGRGLPVLRVGKDAT